MKRHHDQGNSYIQKPFIVAGLQFQRFNTLSSWWEAWQHPGRRGAGGTESSTFWSKGSQEETLIPHWVEPEQGRPQSLSIQCNMLLPTRPQLLIVPFPMNQAYSNQHSIYTTGKSSILCQKRLVSINPATAPLSTKVPCLQDMLVEWWHKTCRNYQAISSLTDSPLGNPMKEETERV